MFTTEELRNQIIMQWYYMLTAATLDVDDYIEFGSLREKYRLAGGKWQGNEFQEIVHTIYVYKYRWCAWLKDLLVWVTVWCVRRLL